MSFLHDSCDGEAPWHCTPTKSFWFMIPRPRPWRIRISVRSFSSFHSISRFGFPISFRELVHQKTKVHQVWPKAVARPKRASYHWASSKFGRGTTGGYSTGRSAVWSDVTQHLDSVREIDIESWARSFVNILVYTFFFLKKLGLMDTEMEIEIDIVSCCWAMNLLAAFNDGGY